MREPDLQSATVRAWHIRHTPQTKEGHVRSWGYEDAGISNWLITGPFHPFWRWWMLSVVHLRQIEGAPPPHLRYPEAEYEFMIMSLSPEGEGRPKEPDIDLFEATGDAERALPGFLSPPDAVVQFHGLNDEQAAELAKLAVHAIVDGHVSPDSDYRSWWDKAVPNTVKHLRGEPH